VSDWIALPSGELAVTLNRRRAFSSTVSVEGAVTTGGKSQLRTVIAVAAVPDSAFDAVNVTLYVPGWAKVGVQLNVPDVFATLFVNVAPNGSGAAVRFVITSPSGSLAVTVKVRDVLGHTCSEFGAVTTGGRSQLRTKIAVVADPVNAFDAVNVTL